MSHPWQLLESRTFPGWLLTRRFAPDAKTPPEEIALEQGNQQSTPIDRAELAEISRGDPAVEHRLLCIFRKANDADVAALVGAIDRRDAATVVRVAHRIMGAARMAGATVLANLGAAIAHAVQSGDWSAIGENRRALHCERARINSYLDDARVAKPGARPVPMP